MSDLFDKVKQTALFALDHSDSIGKLIRDNFAKETIEHLRDRKLLVSQDAIRMEIERIEDAKEWLKALSCRSDGILIELEGKRFGGRLAARLHVRAEELTLNETEQTLVMKIIEETTLGRDILGRVLCGVGSVLIGSFTRYALERSQLVKYADYDELNRRMTIRLGELDVVRQMLEQKISQWEESVPLRFLSVENCEHTDGGIYLNLAVSPLFAKWKEELARALKKDAKHIAEIGKGAVGFGKNVLDVLRSTRDEKKRMPSNWQLTGWTDYD